MKGFSGDALISSYTELVLVGQYVDLEPGIASVPPDDQEP
jgi:hypothetical protein